LRFLKALSDVLALLVSRTRRSGRGIFDCCLGWLNWLQGPQMEGTHFGDEEQAVWQAAQSASL